MAAPDRPRIIAVLSSLGDSGNTAAQLAIYADGTIKPFGDHSVTRAALKILRSHSVALFLKSCANSVASSSPISPKKRPKASSSAPAHSAAGVE